MMPLFAVALILTLLSFAALLKTIDSRMKQHRLGDVKPVRSALSYRPMLRLLNEKGLGAANSRAFRARRRAIFRKYLRCFAGDYAQLLAGLRQSMIDSGVDRPELARAIAKNRFLFMLAMCRIEVRLAAHAVGHDGAIDLSGLIAGMDVLRDRLPMLESNLATSR